MNSAGAEDTALSARTLLCTAEATIGSAPTVMGGDAWWQVLHVYMFYRGTIVKRVQL